MDFNMSDRQREWLNRVESFMHKHVRPAVPIYKQQDEAGERWKVIPVLEDLKKKARAEGLWNMFMPPSAHEDDEFRGAGLTNLEYAPLAEQMGHIGWASEVFNCSAPDTGNMEVLMRYGTKEHKKKWLRPLMDGEIRSAFLMTEPAVASSDATNIETSIKRDGDHYVINGSKTFITNGWQAGLICLAVRTDPKAPGPKALSLLVLETKDLSGYRVGRPLQKIGRHAQDTCELFFDGVRVPVGNLLGPSEGRGLFQMMDQFRYERLSIGLSAVVAAERAVEITAGYVKERQAFGKPLLDLQNTRFKLAECKTETHIGRIFVDNCIQQFIDGRLDSVTAAMAKYWLTDCQCRVVDECVQLHGGYGYMQESPIARLWADSRVQRIYGGANEVLKEVVGSSL